MKKLAVKVVGVAAAFALVFGAAAPASAITAAELLDLLIALDIVPASKVDAAKAALGTTGSTSGSASCATYTRNLTMGSTGADVTNLQTFLEAQGHLTIPTGVSKGYFGSLTRSALAAYQTANGISPAVGYFGPITMASVSAKCSAGGSTDGSTGGSTGSTKLEGGAGSIDSFTLTAGYSNEEVGEGEDDIEVAGLDIENSDGSDIEVKAVKVVFDEGTAGSNFKKYADEVSVWFDGEKVGEADGDDFTDDNTYTQTISLDSGVIIDKGDTGTLVVAVSALNNLDSADEGDTWTVDFTSIRYMDAQGTTITEDPGTGTRTFSFESFASAADIEFKITAGDDDINDANLIIVDDANKTKNVDVFAFDVEIEGDSEVRVDDFSVEATTTRTGATIYIDDLTDAIHLTVDGEKVTTVTPSADENTILFDDLDLDLEPGDHEFVISLDLLSTGGALNQGDTFSFTIGETETDLATTDIDDETGDSLLDADITGSATSGTHGVYEIGISVELVSTSATAQLDGAGGTDDDTGVFTMVFDITAKGGTVYVGDTAAGTTVADGSVGVTVTDAIVYRVYDSGTATTDDLADTVTFTTPSGVTDSSDNIKINEGSTSRVTLTVTQTNDSAEDDGIYYMDLAGIGWGIADDTTYEYTYTFDLEDFETSTINLN